MNIKTLSILTFFVFNQWASAQPIILETSFGLKVGTELSEDILFEGFDANLRTPNFLYSMSYTRHGTLDIFYFRPREIYEQYNLLFGSYLSAGYQTRFEYQAGLGVVWGRLRTSDRPQPLIGGVYEMLRFSTIGVPIKLGLKYIPTKYLSLGIEVLANFNQEHSFARPMVSINFGQIR